MVDNSLNRQFDVDAPNHVWVTEITYIKTYEGYSYLAAIIDLYSRKVLVHSDQGSQFTSLEWASFLKHHNLEHSMSRRGNGHDNAVAEGFFNLLKPERIRRRTYKTSEKARRDVFDYIEMFDNPKRKHAKNGVLSTVEFERPQKWKQQGV